MCRTSPASSAARHWMSVRHAVLDACSAPGGKTFTLAEQMENQGEVVACDLYPARVGLIQSGAERLGLSIVHPRVMTPRR